MQSFPPFSAGAPAASNARGQPTMLAEAVTNGMVEVWRGPNTSYVTLSDQSTNEMVLFAFPLPEATRNDPSRVIAPAMDRGSTRNISTAYAA